MNKTFGIILAVVATFSAGSAFAGGMYVTGGITGADLNTPADTNGLDRTVGANIGIGMDINEWLAVEGTYDYLGSNDFTYQGVLDNLNDGVDVAAKYNARAFTGWVVVDPTVTTIASMPLKVIGRVGYANTKINFSDDDSSGSVSDNNIAYGAGVGLGVTENLDVILDYRVYNVDVDNTDINLNTIGLGAKYTF